MSLIQTIKSVRPSASVNVEVDYKVLSSDKAMLIKGTQENVLAYAHHIMLTRRYEPRYLSVQDGLVTVSLDKRV
jgi:hypothetical protein